MPVWYYNRACALAGSTAIPRLLAVENTSGHSSLDLPNLNIVGGLGPPDGLSATLNECNLLTFLHHTMFL
jgi:hypothetical protein